MKYLLFGDSITWGMHDYVNMGWQGHLKKHVHKLHNIKQRNLKNANIFSKFKNNIELRTKNRIFFNYSFPGDNSKDLLFKLLKNGKRFLDKDQELTIIIAIGTNDSQLENHKHWKSVPEKEFKENIKNIITISKILTKNIFIIGLLPVDEYKTAHIKKNIHYLNTRIKKYNDILKHCSKHEKVCFIDFYDTWIKKDYKELLRDGLHPNKLGHYLIYKKIKSSIFR